MTLLAVFFANKIVTINDKKVTREVWRNIKHNTKSVNKITFVRLIPIEFGIVLTPNFKSPSTSLISQNTSIINVIIAN